MARENFGHCSGCGCSILWVKMRTGNNMPCNPVLVNYKKDSYGKEKIVTLNGEVVTGITGVSQEESDGTGYISHFATCSQAKNFRKKRERAQ